MAHGQFEFKGKGGSYFWLLVWTSILNLITLRLFFPWAIVAKQKWIAKNSYIDGNRLAFKGTGGGFFGNYLLVWFLTIITLGIYLPWGFCRIQRWITNNTYFADEDMQTRPSPPQKKKGIPTILVVIPLVIVGLAVFLLILGWLIPRMGFRSIESREDISEKPLPKRKAYHVNLYIQSNVDGADVYVNGEKQATGTRSSDLKASVFGLRPGTYEIQLKKEGYQDAVKTVELTGDKAVETIIMELEDNP